MDAVGPSNLSRRLFRSYAIAFAIVLAVFALSVRFAFVAMLERQGDARLGTLARAGLAAVRFRSDAFSIEGDITRALRADQEGLQWFDVRGNLVESRGLVPKRIVLPRIGERYAIDMDNDVLLTRTIEIPDHAGVVRGLIRASESKDALRSATQALDLGIAIGVLLATLTATVGGWFLTRQAVRTTEESFERLRQFTADASHELRGPIGAIANNAQLAANENEGLASSTRMRLANIAALANEMRRLVDDLLILARAVQPMTRELFVVDLDKILERVCARLLPEATAKQIRLILSPSQLPSLYGNPEQIERLIDNLVANAIRYTNEGGAVTITALIDATHIKIVVSDTGIGIAADHVPYIFDRFWRADPVRGPQGSNGLGLSIALALARRHGGNIAVTTALGSGSTFTLSLPRRPTA
jgi:OmpR-family two-component system manganese-sensing sensor histidine kinase